MSVWRRWPITQSPYARTAFRLARVPREIVRHRTVVQLIGQTSQVVASGGAHVVSGRAVTVEELNWAEQVLHDPLQRLQEELIEHAAERAPTEALRKLDRRAAELMAPGAASDDKAAAGELLRLGVGGLVEAYLGAAPPAEPSLGAAELELCAPFGPDEEA